ncbi:MAG: hypothetical protein LBG80_07595 [Bacteroidales bacterium]|jgi:hypothetical protein|nr:hypothetical protein [Bacteroidales bacterium]
MKTVILAGILILSTFEHIGGAAVAANRLMHAFYHTELKKATHLNPEFILSGSCDKNKLPLHLYY